jgi:hypothetical protein
MPSMESLRFAETTSTQEICKSPEQFTHMPLIDALMPLNAAIRRNTPLEYGAMKNYLIAILKSEEDHDYSIKNAMHLLHLFFAYRLPDSVDEEDPLLAYTAMDSFENPLEERWQLYATWHLLGHTLPLSKEALACHKVAIQLFENVISQAEYGYAFDTFMSSMTLSPRNDPLGKLIFMAGLPKYSKRTDLFSRYEEEFDKQLSLLRPELKTYLTSFPIDHFLLCRGELIQQHEKELSIIHSNRMAPSTVKKTLENLLVFAKIDLEQIPYHTEADSVAYSKQWIAHLKKLEEIAPDIYEDILFRVWQTGCECREGYDAKVFIQEHGVPNQMIKEAVILASKAPRLFPVVGSPRPFISQLIGETSASSLNTRFFYFAQLFHHGASQEQLRMAFHRLRLEDQALIRTRAPMVDGDMMHWRVKQAVQEINIELRLTWEG